MLQHLRLTSFRCHPSLELENLGPRVLLSGANGQGKTTLLESVAILGRMRSFRTRAYRELTQHGAEGWRVDGSWADEAGPVRLGMVWRNGARELEVDGRVGATVDEFWEERWWSSRMGETPQFWKADRLKGGEALTCY